MLGVAHQKGREGQAPLQASAATVRLGLGIEKREASGIYLSKLLSKNET